MQEELEQATKIYELIVTFLVNYSFQIVGALLILVLGIFVAGKVSAWLFKFCQSKNLDITLSKFLANIVRLAFILMVGIIALGNIGISVTPFVAAIGALSLGAGLALQGLLSNYGAGLNIIITRPFVVGDTINVQGVSGIVSEVSLSTTILMDEDGVQITIPNKHIVGEIIHNSGEVTLLEIAFRVSPEADAEQAIAAGTQAVHETEGLGKDTRMVFGISEITGAWVEVTGRIWVPTAQYFHYKFVTTGALHRLLAEKNIALAVPSQDIRLHSESPE